jgi:hypothetical protein
LLKAAMVAMFDQLQSPAEPSNSSVLQLPAPESEFVYVLFEGLGGDQHHCGCDYAVAQ